jgi:hypothetical protein
MQIYSLSVLRTIHITKNISTLMEELEKIPDWLTTGITYLPPKSGDSKAVRNYQPITCLTTMYKTLTGTIARRISTSGRAGHITS